MTTDVALEKAARVVARKEAWQKYASDPARAILETDRTWPRMIPEVKEIIEAYLAALPKGALAERPIPMVLYCPACGVKHIDEPDERTPGWSNPPHRSHLCHGCGHIWRPADVPTTGVAEIKTAGKNDSPLRAAASLLGGGVPEGWVMVPKKPTRKMLDEMGRYRVGDYGTGREFYKAMIAARPPESGRE